MVKLTSQKYIELDINVAKNRQFHSFALQIANSAENIEFYSVA